MRWPLAESTLIRLLSYLSASDDPADRQFADAIEEALVRAEQVELLKEVNRDLRHWLSDLETARCRPDPAQPRPPRGPRGPPVFAVFA